jgi:ubiquinone/menaquinone biosynthesis C-methylase UbiE
VSNATEKDYLDMQKSHYDKDASRWTLENKNPVVGSYHAHNEWADYDTYLFKDFDTKDLIALDYGTGPGRNIVKFNNRFKRIDGVDISQTNIDKARINLEDAGIHDSKLYACDGKNIPADDDTYDVVFSVICFQHICCHSIRYNILKEAYRVLKPGGHLCFQMGYGGRDTNSRVFKVMNQNRFSTVSYYENATDAKATNGLHDVSITDKNDLKSDLQKIGFGDFKFDIRPVGPGDHHKNWIFVQGQK